MHTSDKHESGDRVSTSTSNCTTGGDTGEQVERGHTWTYGRAGERGREEEAEGERSEGKRTE
eukprot:4324147-Alexandrium_andersonii.AAC.1